MWLTQVDGVHPDAADEDAVEVQSPEDAAAPLAADAASSEAGPSATDRSSPDSDVLPPSESSGIAAAAADVRRLRRGRRNGRHMARLAEVLGEAHGSPAAAPEHAAAAAPGASDRSHSQVCRCVGGLLVSAPSSALPM